MISYLIKFVSYVMPSIIVLANPVVKMSPTSNDATVVAKSLVLLVGGTWWFLQESPLTGGLLVADPLTVKLVEIWMVLGLAYS